MPRTDAQVLTLLLMTSFSCLATSEEHRFWWENRQKFNKLQERIGQHVTKAQEWLSPDVKEALKADMKALASIKGKKGILGVPTQQEIQAQLVIDGVQSGSADLVTFMVQECGIKPEAVSTLEYPNLLAALKDHKKDHLTSPEKMAKTLAVLGLKPADAINEWNKDGKPFLHQTADHMLAHVANAQVKLDQFTAAMGQKGQKFKDTAEAKSEWTGFVKLSNNRAHEWVKVADWALKHGAKNLADKDGKKVLDYLKAADAKHDAVAKAIALFEKRAGAPAAAATPVKAA